MNSNVQPETGNANGLQPAQRRGDTIAMVIAEVFSPPWVAIALLGLVALHSSGDVAQFLQSWLSASFFLILIPLGVIIVFVKQGRLTDRQLSRANQRYIPFTAVIVSAGVGMALLLLLDAPIEVLAIIIGAVVGVIVALPITPFFKLSIHTAAVAGSAAILAIEFTPWLLFLGGLVPIVGWARIRTSHHTVQQAVAGAFIGTVVAFGVYLGVLVIA